MKKILSLILISTLCFSSYAQTQVGADRIKKGSGVFADANNALAVVGVNSNVVVTVRMATTAALTGTWVYNNGASGVGATLTRAAAGALAAIDGVTPVANDLLLVKDQSTQANNGVYVITTLGDGGTATVLTRTTNSDATAELDNQAVKPTLGTTNGTLLFRQTTAIPTVGSSNIVYTDISGLFHTQIQFQDEGSNLGTTGTANVVDFTGAGVSSSRTGNKVTVSIAGGGGGGINSLNLQTGGSQTFATGTTGTDFDITSSGNTHTFNLPDASVSARGAVTTSDQTFTGTKTTEIFNVSQQYNVNDVFFATEDAGFNVKIGSGAAPSLDPNNLGIINVIIGSNASNLLVDGYHNTVVGYNAGSASVSDVGNTFIGTSSGENTNGGGENTFVGASAGEDNTDGARNVYIGKSTGGESANDNVCIGNDAGEDLTNGSNNTIVGRNAGFGVKDGSSNVFIGINATGSESTSKSVVLGQGATATMDNQFVVGDDSPGNNIENWKINGIDYVMPSAHGTGTLNNDGSGVLNWGAQARSHSSVTLAVNTARAPSSTNDVEVIITFQQIVTTLNTGESQVQVDNSGGGSFVPIGTFGHWNNTAVTMRYYGTITFTCPVGSQYKWTSPDGSTTVTSIYELIK